MKKLLCAGAVALAMTGLLPTLPATASDYGSYAEQGAATAINVARIKSALHLRPDQERYWPPVEAALRRLAERQHTKAETGGFVHRISSRVVSVVLDNAAIARLASAARPLVAVLDPEQMQAASGLADEMGLGPVVAALR
jgi:zinc resistance-associated protein